VIRPWTKTTKMLATVPSSFPLWEAGQGGRTSATPPRLLDRVRADLRSRHYSPRTEKTYVAWIRRFILFHSKRHPENMSGADVGDFLSHLANHCKVSAGTQNQALAALLFLFQRVLGRRLEWKGNLVHAKRPVHVPVVLGRDEVRNILAHVHGLVWLVCALMYGGGLRLLEALQLRVTDIDLDRREIVVRSGKGQKERRTVLPGVLIPRLRSHLATVKTQHEEDIRMGAGAVALPSPSTAGIPERPTRGCGSGSFLRTAPTPIRRAKKFAGHTCTKPSFSAPSAGPP
jgi:integrase